MHNGWNVYITPCLQRSLQTPKLWVSVEEIERESVNKEDLINCMVQTHDYTQHIVNRWCLMILLWPTRLNAPIPNDIPPSKWTWLGPLRQLGDFMRECSSLDGKKQLRQLFNNTARHDNLILYNVMTCDYAKKKVLKGILQRFNVALPQLGNLLDTNEKQNQNLCSRGQNMVPCIGQFQKDSILHFP